MQYLDLPFHVGILGGGQLARMLVLEAHAMGLTPHVLSASPDDPAAQVTKWWQQGDPNDQKAVESFLRLIDVATFESEFFSAPMLSQVSKAVGTPIYPHPDVMGLLQDRAPQKQLLVDMGIPTAPFVLVNSAQDLMAATRQLGLPFVLKKRRYGYDGYGTFIIKNQSQIKPTTQLIGDNPDGFVAEAFIPFRREMAVMIGRSRDGSTSLFPLVESFQQDSRCLWVKGPAQHRQWRVFGKKLTRLLEEIEYVGVLGVEMFDLGQTLLVNELAPRVHNTGHYSMDALSESQFTQHLKAILGQQLKSPSPTAKGFAMLNLLGAGNQDCQWQLTPGVQVHWYGKKESRPGRKLGHLNATAGTAKMALDKLINARRHFKI